MFIIEVSFFAIEPIMTVYPLVTASLYSALTTFFYFTTP